MSNSYSLDDLKAELDKEFAPLTLNVNGEPLVLKNLMRIADAAREKVSESLNFIQAQSKAGQKADEENDEEYEQDVPAMAAALTQVLRNVVDAGKGETLVKYVDGDMLLGMRILELWTEATQPGEAESSSD